MDANVLARRRCLAHHLGKRAFVAACFVVASAVTAAPVTYTASVVTDIKIGAMRYHNAAVTITFTGDTNQIRPVLDQTGQPIASDICPSANNPQSSGIDGMGPYFFALAKGRASISVESQGHTHSATFLPGQIFVSFDTCNGGIGFGSFTGSSGIEPAYPLAFSAGTAMSFTYNAPHPLTTSGNFTGYAWSCVGFAEVASHLSTSCTSPDAYPLHTSAGDVSIYMPYQYYLGQVNGTSNDISPHSGSVNRGIFSISVGTED